MNIGFQGLFAFGDSGKMTLTEKLSSVQSAITAIETGAQSWTLPGGESMTKANLKTLYDRETRLMALIARENAGISGARVRRIEIG